jgi:hypothetical protein
MRHNLKLAEGRPDMPASKASREAKPLGQAVARNAVGSLPLYRVNAGAGNEGGHGWGGKRNRADRVSFRISPVGVAGLISAVAHAAQIGLPLNRMITVNWTALGLVDAQAAQATGRLLKLLRDALADLGLPFAHAYLRENDAGNGEKGSHVHILAHIPLVAAKSGFMRRLRIWARLAAGGRYAPQPKRQGRRRSKPAARARARAIEGPAYAKGAANTRRIGGKAQVAPGVYVVNLWMSLRYMLKGADAETAQATGLERHSEGARIIGKRCGWSENIGAAARARGAAKSEAPSRFGNPVGSNFHASAVGNMRH